MNPKEKALRPADKNEKLVSVEEFLKELSSESAPQKQSPKSR